jgi:hypothetical protein
MTLKQRHENLLKKLSVFSSKPCVVAVTKKQSLETIKGLYELGYRHFGENYLDEAASKINQLIELKDIHWHYIGSLQTKKITKIVSLFDFIHSVESLKHINKIESQSLAQKKEIHYFLEVNFENEESKSGFSPDEALNCAKLIPKESHSKCIGLMFMPPITENVKRQEKTYKKIQDFCLDEQFTRIQGYSRDTMDLSMGTSHDFEMAIKYGSSFIRIGEVLCGPRLT